jgi:trans-aconitate methyltransferase
MRAVLRPFRFKVLPRELLDRRPLRILDVGCANHVPSITKKWLPGCEYHGIDREWNANDEADAQATDRFFQADLDVDDLQAVPDAHYDLVLLTHVIEHLAHGHDALRRLAAKVRPGGYLYVETPSERSLSLPSMPGTLNFYDDPTHVRVYPAAEIADALRDAGFRILYAGPRRDWLRVALTPVAFPLRYLLQRKKAAGDLWDLTGFAAYVVALRPA